jgi:hypothetical protein
MPQTHRGVLAMMLKSATGSLFSQHTRTQNPKHLMNSHVILRMKHRLPVSTCKHARATHAEAPHDFAVMMQLISKQHEGAAKYSLLWISVHENLGVPHMHAQ